MLGFKGIIESKMLWLSDLSMTKDPREMVLGSEIFFEVMLRLGCERFVGVRSFLISQIARQIERYLA